MQKISKKYRKNNARKKKRKDLRKHLKRNKELCGKYAKSSRKLGKRTYKKRRLLIIIKQFGYLPDLLITIKCFKHFKRKIKSNTRFKTHMI